MPLLFIFLLTQEPQELSGIPSPELEAQETSEAIADQLDDLKDNPVSLNTARAGDLVKIYWISPELADAIISARTKKNGFKKIDELKDVPGMSPQIFENIKPYIIIYPEIRVIGAISSQPVQPANALEIRERTQKTLPEEQGKLGSPEKVYQRMKLNYTNVSGVLLLEKGAYEKSYSDFISYGMVISGKPNGTMQKVALGNYMLDFAEGLLFATPSITTFKNQGVLKGKSTGINLYTVAGENTLLRGAALEYKLPNSINNYIFYSNANLDAKIDSTDTTIYYSYEGDHSTASGLAKKGRVKEELWGTRFEYSHNPKLGVTYYKNTHSLNTDGNKIDSHNLLGFDFSLAWGKFEWFGEAGRCDRTSAEIIGAEYATKRIKLGTLYRYYPDGFYLFHSSPFSDRTVTYGSIAEKGNYFYGSYALFSQTILNCYVDYFTRLPKKDSGEVFVQGSEYWGNIEHKFLPNFSGIVQLYLQKLDTTETKRFRLQTDIGIRNTTFRIRMEKAYEGEKNGICQAGLLWYGNIGMRLSKSSTIAVRGISFNSDVSIYESELDLPGTMTTSCLTDKGTRAYLYLEQDLSSSLAISFKYGLTSEPDSKTEKFGAQLDLKI